MSLVCRVLRLVVGLTLLSSSAFAWVIEEDPFEERSTEIGVLGRGFHFISAGPVLEPPLAPEGSNPSGQSIFDARLYASHKTASYRFVVHNQSTMILSSLATTGGLNLGRGLPPPRLLPLTFVHQEDTIRLQNMTDWMFAELRLDQLTLTVGRQPVSFGRGSLWHTNDVVSMFALTEVDTLYKRGADAVRVDWSLPARQNLTLLSSFGSIDASRDRRFGADETGSTGVAQYKKAWDEGEFAVMAGFVRGDGMISADATTSVLGFDLYGELTGFALTDLSLESPAVENDYFVKALLGASFRPMADLTIVPEFFYSGLGATDPADYLPALLSDRFQIGDQRAVGRYYGSVMNLWQVTPLATVTWGMMANLGDPSGLLLSAVAYSISDNTSAQLGMYAPIGYAPRIENELFPIPTIESEFGNYPYFFFAQLSATL